jgi:hypothetical protein
LHFNQNLLDMINNFLTHKLASFGQNSQVFTLLVAKETSKKDLTDNKCWRNIALAVPALRVGDRIEITREDFAFFAEVLIVGKQKDELFLKLLRFHELEKDIEEENLSKDYKVVWKGPIKKWTLFRISDNKEIKDQFASREEADYFLKNY